MRNAFIGTIVDRALQGCIGCCCLVLLAGCAGNFSYLKSPPVPDGREVCYIEGVPPVLQGTNQCGPAALESVMRYWGREVEIKEPHAQGMLNFSLIQSAKDHGFWTETSLENKEQLKTWINKKIPLIVMLDTGVLWVRRYHFAVLVGFNERDRIFYMNAGGSKAQTISYEEFGKRWDAAGRWNLIVCPPEKVDWDLSAEDAVSLAFLFEQSARLDLAERWYVAALNRNPDSELARFNLANVYLKTKRWPEAEALYSGLLKKQAPFEGWERVVNNLAWAYLEEGRLPEAIELLETSLKMGGEGRFDLLDTLGLAYLKRGDTERAEKCFLEAMEKAKDENPQAFLLIKRHAESLS